MADSTTQSLQAHARNHPPFHFVMIPFAVLNLIYAVYRLVREPGFETAWFVVTAIVLSVAFFLIRVYPLKVQDRLIRLEERLRMRTLLSDSLMARTGELTEKQYVALRFASDAELASLVEATLNERLPPPEIKKRIKTWRADFFRV